MKRIIVFELILLTAACPLLWCCSSDDTGNTEPESVRIVIETEELSFKAKDTRSITVSISSEAQWKYECLDGWVMIDRVDGGLTVGVEHNEETTDRVSAIRITNGTTEESIEVTQQRLRPGKLTTIPANLPPMGMSSNGRFAVGYKESVSFLWDNIEQTIIQIDGSANGVTDDGRLICGIHNDQAAVWEDGSWTMLDLPAGIDGVMSNARAITPDGGTIVGYVFAGTITYPVVWVDRVPRILEMPATGPLGEKFEKGYIARKISDDGRVIFGEMNMVSGGGVLWIDGKAEFVNGEKWSIGEFQNPETGQAYLTYSNIFSYGSQSLCGNFCGGYLNTFTDDGFVNHPYYTDLTTGNTVVFEEFADGYVSAIREDGTAFFACPVLSALREGMVYDIHSGTYTTFDRWASDNYDVRISRESTVMAVSADSETLLVMGYGSSGYENYMLSYDE